MALVILCVFCSGTFHFRDGQTVGSPASGVVPERQPSTRVQPAASADYVRLGAPSLRSSSESDPSVTISVNGVQGVPATIDGKNYSLPQTFNWITGTQHNISVVGMAYPAAGTRAVFIGWSGYQTSMTPQTSLVVNSDAQLAANYRTEFLETLKFITADGERVYPSSATLLGPSGKNISLAASDPIWMNSGAAYTLVGVVWSNVAVGPVGGTVSTIVPSSPAEIVIPLAIYRGTIRVVDVFGLSFKGVSVTVTGANGSQVTRLTDGNGVVSMELPFGYYSASVLYFGFTVEVRDYSIGPNATTVTLFVNYPTVLAVIVSVGAYLCYVVRHRIKKRMEEAAPYRVSDSASMP